MSLITYTPDDLFAGRRYTFHNDAGHGWLEVNRTDLVELNITTKITQDSYQKKNKVFLDENCDLPAFFSAYENRFGISLTMGNLVLANVVYDGDVSPIRGYVCYCPA